MKSTTRLLGPKGFPGLWKRSFEEFKRLSNIAIRLDGVHPTQSSLELWNFSTPEAVDTCTDMSDRDIGGYSQSEFKHVQTTSLVPAHARFSGIISNKLPSQSSDIERTGYAAWRTLDRPRTVFGKPFWDVEGFRYLALRVKADGRKYKVNVQTDSVIYTDLHQHRLYTRHPGEWETVTIKWSDFVRTNHGIVVEPQSEMMKEKIRTVGIGLTDRQPGPFELCISRIWTTNHVDDLDDETTESIHLPRH